MAKHYFGSFGPRGFIEYPISLAIIGVALIFVSLGYDRMLLLERLGFGLCGGGLIVAGGFSEALRHDPAESDVFPFRVLARVGFILTGIGAGLAVAAEASETTEGFILAGLFIVPAGISLAKLLWTRRRENMKER